MLFKHPGRLILFEGCEGSGKSTLIKRLADILRWFDYNVLETKEPGHDTKKGVKIREVLMDPNFPMTSEEELALFFEGRSDHFEKIIIPALQKGKIILCDRSSPSTISYQHYGRGLDLTDILVQDAKARKNINFDMIFLLDISPKSGLMRKKPASAADRFELEAINFHNRVRSGYLEQAKNDPEKKWIIIDASKPIKEVLNEVRGSVMEFLNRRSNREK